jgi:membrane protein implicated in regulation of membrane protease activity
MSTLVGSSFLAISTLLGQIGHHGTNHSAGNGAHDAGSGHSLLGHSHGQGVQGHGLQGHGLPGHGTPGHSADLGHGQVSHAVDGSGGHAQIGHGVNIGDGTHGNAVHSVLAPADNTAAQVARSSGIISRSFGKIHKLHVETKEENIVQLILGLLNPLSIATFMTFFGLAGAILSLKLNTPAIISLPLAIFVGWVAVQVVVRLIAWLAQNMRSSSEAKIEDLVGRMAEVTVPISQGKTGEITYVINSKRYSSPAKSLKEGGALTKRTKVMICELNGPLLMVEPWTDTFIDPEFDSPQYP